MSQFNKVALSAGWILLIVFIGFLVLCVAVGHIIEKLEPKHSEPENGENNEI